MNERKIESVSIWHTSKVEDAPDILYFVPGPNEKDEKEEGRAEKITLNRERQAIEVELGRMVLIILPIRQAKQIIIEYATS